MNYSNQPVYGIMPFIPHEIAIYFDIAVVLFIIWFFAHLHWWLHKQQHGFPPLYFFWIKRLWDRCLAAMKP